MEQIENILKEMGYTTKPGFGSEFEIFAYDSEGNSIAVVKVGDKISAVSNRDVETQDDPEFFEVENERNAIIVAASYAMSKDASLKDEVK